MFDRGLLDKEYIPNNRYSTHSLLTCLAPNVSEAMVRYLRLRDTPVRSTF
jgi:hypothetical protein